MTVAGTLRVPKCRTRSVRGYYGVADTDEGFVERGRREQAPAAAKL